MSILTLIFSRLIGFSERTWSMKRSKNRYKEDKREICSFNLAVEGEEVEFEKIRGQSYKINCVLNYLMMRYFNLN